jgi:membrane-associated phospholipid phosphatase
LDATKLADKIHPSLQNRPVAGRHPGFAGLPLRRCIVVSVFVILGFGVALVMDRSVYLHFYMPMSVYQDWHRLFRGGGYMPLWLLLAVAWMLIDRDAIKLLGVRRALARGILLAASVVCAGIGAEILKILIRRERPGMHDGHFYFRAWQDSFLDGSGLALPSSHATVAFAATWVLCLLYPRATPVWLLVGLGCGVSRLLDRAHFLSDVYLAAVASFVCVRLLWSWIAKDFHIDATASAP